MDTNFSKAWRSKRFSVDQIAAAISQAQKAVMHNFNQLANDSDVGKAATAAFGMRIDGVDVAMRYLATTHGSMNETGMLKMLTGDDTGAALMNAYGQGSAPTSVPWRNLGLGDEQVIPWIDVTEDGATLKIGLPNTPGRARFALAFIDPTRVRHANPNITGKK